MINITNARARQQYLAEMTRMMIRLENTQARALKPVLNRQFLDAAKLVRQGVLDAVDYVVDNDRKRLLMLFSKHYRRVAVVFSNKTYKIVEGSKKFIIIPEIKGPKDEFWTELNWWMQTETAKKVSGIQKTSKKILAKIIQKGMGEGLSNTDIAKNLVKNGRISTPFRAKTIAITETHTAAVKSVDSAIKSTRIEMEREWVANIDKRTRPDHVDADGQRVAQDGMFIIGGIPMAYPGDPRGGADQTVRCLTSYKTPIYTSEGWKWVKNIKVGDLVLTHKNRFKKVLRLNSDFYDGEVITIKLDGRGWYITVTPEHPFLMQDGSWKNAKDINENDQISFMASYCQWCGKAIPYYQKYCDISCSSKATTDRQWKDPKHRKNMSEKASAQMKMEYENGIRDPKEITKKARKAHFDKWGTSGSLKILSKDPEFQKKRLKAIEKKYGSVFDMIKLKCFPALGKIHFGGSKLEKSMEGFLIRCKRKFVAQFEVGRRRIDFYIKREKLFIEVDGKTFHSDKEKERKRDLEILTQHPNHKIAHVTYGNPGINWEFFDLLSLNHTGTFAQTNIRVKAVSIRQVKEKIRTYNFAVEDDESYIAKGFVTHNCRCVLMYHAVKRLDRLKPYVPEPGFVPVKTIGEAELWALDNIKGLKKASFAGFETKQANSVLKELDLLQKNHGKLGNIEGIKTLPKSVKFAARMNEGKILEIRRDMTDDYFNKLSKSGIIKSKEGLAGLVDHEIGHAMTPDIFDISGKKPTMTQFGKRLDKFFEKNKTKIIKEITPYAGTARHEFVAEAFAFREAGTAPKWILNWLKSEGI